MMVAVTIATRTTPENWPAAVLAVDTMARSSNGYTLITLQESPAVADKPARRLRKVCTVYVRAVGL